MLEILLQLAKAPHYQVYRNLLRLAHLILLDQDLIQSILEKQRNRIILILSQYQIKQVTYFLHGFTIH